MFVSSLPDISYKKLHYFVCLDDNIDETYGINVQFEESEEEVRSDCFLYCVPPPLQQTTSELW